ncbi:hypothetical protein Esi_0395_0010 [Ectocarpus siliculosus]|uniref:Uncharacterized protein n=1 Tax=Ectocarpus siliculosus TaxID=2880 RepID=D7G067_ECTSI|nr:hypothetical protein Esi_0395_0010 [Ectocarpus siliculosus]|eukprot:CBJ32949.1 hypothetical protein Esi_0395_0010 [Ectocarpus siliculosus]
MLPISLIAPNSLVSGPLADPPVSTSRAAQPLSRVAAASKRLKQGSSDENTEPDSSVCYDFRKQYFNCLHLPTVNTMSEKQMDFMEERKDTLVLASKALQSGASGSAPAKPPGEEST